MRIPHLAATIMLIAAVVACAPNTEQASIPSTAAPVSWPPQQFRVGECHARTTPRGVLPDAACTPGALNPAVTQDTLKSTICQSGWAEKDRPPEKFTNELKFVQIREYGYSDLQMSDYEEDHLIPIELGGRGASAKNLWPEPAPSPNPKDTVEDDLHRAVCAGRVPLAAAQQAIARDWTTAERSVGIS